MPDSLKAASPLPNMPVVHANVVLSAAPSMSRYSLRARNAAQLAVLIGRNPPEAIGGWSNGIARLGPDECYALLPAGETLPSGEGEPVSVVDVSSRAVGIVVEGPGAPECIMSGCPLDLERMAPGRAIRTVYETVEIILLRESDTRFHIDVWRSFAPWLWQALAEAR